MASDESRRPLQRATMAAGFLGIAGLILGLAFGLLAMSRQPGRDATALVGIVA